MTRMPFQTSLGLLTCRAVACNRRAACQDFDCHLGIGFQTCKMSSEALEAQTCQPVAYPHACHGPGFRWLQVTNSAAISKWQVGPAGPKNLTKSKPSSLKTSPSTGLPLREWFAPPLHRQSPYFDSSLFGPPVPFARGRSQVDSGPLLEGPQQHGSSPDPSGQQHAAGWDTPNTTLP